MITLALDSMARFAIVLFAIFTATCGASDLGKASETNPQPTPPVVSQSPVVDGPARGNEAHLREDGWEIPPLAPGTKETFERSIADDDKKAVKVSGTIFRLEPFHITDQPFASIGSSLGTIQIREVIEYKTAKGVFCYEVEANGVVVDEATNMIRYSHAVLFSFSFFDQDGDGKFESLFSDPGGRIGMSKVVNAPHVPEWAK